MSQHHIRKARYLGQVSAISLGVLAGMAVSTVSASAAPPNNTDTYDNSGNYVGDVTSNTGAGVINNNSGGVWTGDVISNDAIINNKTGAIWNGNVFANTGTLNNDGAWNGTIASSKTFNNTVNGAVSGLTNYNGGSLANAGALNGGLQVNQNTDGDDDIISNAGTIGGTSATNGVSIGADVTVLAITGAGTITGNSVGILDQDSGADGITLETGTGAISGKDTGISLTSIGAITLTTNGKIFTAGGNGIDVRQTNGGVGDITITSNGAIASDPINTDVVFNNGIKANVADGSNANITVNVNANIGSSTDIGTNYGTFVGNGATAGVPNLGNLNINIANASAYGQQSGLFAQQNGQGNITIKGTGTGTVLGGGSVESDAPIYGAGGQIAGGGLGAITINITQDAIGRTAGLGATTDGGGNISITTTGAAKGLFRDRDSGAGILALNSATAANSGTINITANGPVSGGYGIQTNSGQSTGLTTITINGEVSATQYDGFVCTFGECEFTAIGGTGIQATSTKGGITTNIAAGAKIDPLIGIDHITVSGALTINNAGLIQGDNIGMRLTSTGTGVVGDLTLAQTGTGAIQITNAGGGLQGAVLQSIDANLKVTGNGAATIIDGINAIVGLDLRTTGLGAISVSDNTIKGGSTGLRALQTGAATTGISVTGTGDISAITRTAVDLTIDNAANTGNITYNRSGNISGSAGILAGIDTGRGSVNVTITGTSKITSEFDAIAAYQDDFSSTTGDVTVTTSAGSTVASGILGTAIFAANSTQGSGVVTVLNNAAIKSDGVGISAFRQAGSGDTTVTSTGSIGSNTAPGQIKVGIVAVQGFGATGNVTVNLTKANIGSATDVALAEGIVAGNRSKSAGNVTGNLTVNLDSASIYAGGSTDRGGNAIDANQIGVGNITVSGIGAGTISSANGLGINAAILRDRPGAITVDVTQDIISASSAIRATTAGTGNISINKTSGGGNITASFGDTRAIAAFNNSVTANAATIDITVGAGKLISASRGEGIVTDSGISTGTTTITNNGDIKTADGGIRASSAGGIVINGIGSITSLDGTGIETSASGAADTKITLGGDVSGGGDGISAFTDGGGNILIATGGNITASGRASTAITAFNNSVTANAAAIDITVGAGKLISAARGRGIETDSGISTGATTITNNGDIRTFSTGIRAASEGGIVINGIGSVTSLTRTGINTSTSGAADTKITLGGNVSGDRAGISAFTDGGGNILIATGGNITAGNGNGISASNVNGAANTGAIGITLSAGKTITATGGNGIVTNSGLSTGTSTVTVNGEISANATDDGEGGVNGGTGIRQASFGNNTILIGATGKIDPLIGTDQLTVGGANLVTVMAGGLITGDNIAVRQTANTTGTNTVDNAGTITGTAQQGVLQVVNNGNALVRGSGIISGGSNAVEITSSGSGNITVNGSNTITGGTGSGISATQNATGTGAIAIQTTGGNIAATGDAGIAARIQNAANTSAILIDVAGKVSGSSAIFATTLGGGNITVNARGNLTGLPGEGIDIRNLTTTQNTGAINVLLASSAALTSSQFNGISAIYSGPSTGKTTIVSNGTVDAFLNGIQAVATGGDVSLTTTGTVISRSNGTNALTVNTRAATGNIDITASGALTTNTAFSVTGNVGIAATNGNAANSGRINITTTSGATIRASTGILALNKGSGTATIITGADIIATGAGIAVLPDAIFPPVALSPGAAIITANGNVTGNAIGGILVVGGNANTINGAGNVSSALGFGISVNSGLGATTITQGGNISGKTFGVQVNALGGGNVTIATGGNVTATDGTGISAVQAFPGVNLGRIAITVAAGKLVLATGGNGITTNSGQSLGATTITVNGEVTAPGKTGVQATSTRGNITLNVAATGKIDPVIGAALTTVDGVLAVNNLGLIQGDTTGVSLVATGAGIAAVVNAGTITGGRNAVSGSTNGTVFAITNSATGILNGAINVTGSGIPASVFSNSGIWNATTGSIYSGNLVNSGTTNLAAAGTIAVLGNASNLGMLNLTNGATNNLVTVGGTYTGGGTLRVDANTATVLADQLTIGGAATGITAVIVNETGIGVLPGGFLPIVTVAPGASAATFVDGGSNLSTSGFLIERFGQSPTSNTQFGIIQAVNPTAAIVGGLSSFASAMSSMAYEPVGPYVTAKTNPGANQHQFGIWMRGGAGTTTNTLGTNINGLASTVPITTTQRISHQLLQFGADYGVLNLGGHGANIHLGVTGGAIDGNANPVGGQIRYHANFVGGYAYFTVGGLSLDAIYNHEWRRYDVASQSLFGDASPHRTHGQANAGAAHISYRIGRQQGLALTPLAAISYSGSQIDPLALSSNTLFTATNDKGLVYSGGAKLSFRGTVGNVVVEPFVGARYMHNGSNHEQGVFSLANLGSPVNFIVDTAAWRNAAQYSLGFTGRSPDGRISTFATATFDTGSHLKGATFSIGVRFNF